MTPFQSYEWYKGINDLFIRERKKNIFRRGRYIVLYDEKNNPKFIAPIQIVHTSVSYNKIGIKRGFYFIGRCGYSDYLNFIYNNFEEEYLEVLGDYLSTKYKLNYFYFENMIENTKAFKYLQESKIYKVVDKSKCTCVSLTLPETFEEYNKSLSKHSRQNIRTEINRSKKKNKEFTYELTSQLDDKLIKNFNEIRNTRLKEKRKKSLAKCSFKGKIYNLIKGGIDNFANEENDIYRNNCSKIAFIVREHEEVAAFYYGLYNKNLKTMYVMTAGVNKEFEWFSPAIHQLYLFIKKQYEEGVLFLKTIDFTRGGEKYKYALGGKEIPVSSIKLNYKKVLNSD